ncbi:MAG TPA: HlyD family efflux transporter periplasmic adaptor subunit, partial [Mycobacterium sp.]|nr:HlyD family efflux transporter periplasmic adaptor subunit [Mycobacterium sp.]
DVKKGDVLFTMTSDTLQTAVEQAKNSYDQAQSSLTSAQLQLEKAQDSLDTLIDNYNSERWTDQGNDQANAGGSTVVAAAWSTTTPIEVAAINTTPPSTTTTTIQHTTTTTTPKSSTTTSTISDLDVALAQQQVTSAQLQVQVAQTNVTLAKMSLQDAKDNVSSLKVTAPISGTVTALNVEVGDKLSASGSGGTGGGSSQSSSNSSSSADVVITDLSKWDVTVTLAESDVSSVKVGQKAKLTFDALSTVSLTGKVTSMDTSGTNSSGVVSYTATITPDAGNNAILGGMTVTTEIVTFALADVLAVPTTAVKTGTNGTKYVLVMGTSGVPTETTVEVGEADDTYTQITSGLTAGQEVVTASVVAGATTTTVRRNGTSGGLLNSGGATGGFQGGGPPPGF